MTCLIFYKVMSAGNSLICYNREVIRNMNTSTGNMPKNVRKHVLRSTNKVNVILLLSGIVNSLLFWYYDATVMFYYSICLFIQTGSEGLERRVS